MSFRKDKNDSREWQRWLARCGPALILCGVPEDAYASQRNWWYLLDHASMSTGKETHWFTLDQLPSERLLALRDLLEREYGDREHPPHLLEVVRSRLRSAAPP